MKTRDPHLDDSGLDPLGAEPRGWHRGVSYGVAGAAALVVALLVSSQIQWSMKGHGHDWWRLFLWQLGGWGFWALVLPRSLDVGASLARPRVPWAGWVARQGFWVSALVFVHLAFAAWIFVILQPFEPVDAYTYGESWRRAVGTWFVIDFLIYGMGLTIGYGLESYRKARRAEVREARLETELAKAQLETLRLQMQPHFLFNSLHSIAALIRRQKSERALEMLLGLSDLLRATLEISARSSLPLDEELEFVRLYVDLQKARFADRLTVTYDVDDDCLGEQVPALLLQPLVENAIRHGIAPRAAPGRIEISARRVGDDLVLSVIDDGVGLPEGFEPDRDHGVGLGNTGSRLQQIYGDRASFEVRRLPVGGTMVRASFPGEPRKIAAMRARAS